MLGILVYFSNLIQSLYYVIRFKTIRINSYHFTKFLHTNNGSVIYNVINNSATKNLVKLLYLLYL